MSKGVAPKTEIYDHAASERAVERLRAEHEISIEWLPGAIEWSCSCGSRSAVSGYYRTEAQVTASSRRHLRAVRNRYYDEERRASDGSPKT